MTNNNNNSSNSTSTTNTYNFVLKSTDDARHKRYYVGKFPVNGVDVIVLMVILHSRRDVILRGWLQIKRGA